MVKEKYHQYLKSKEWLLKKNELISIYLKQGWSIECFGCGGTDGLQVHHMTYKEVGKEDLSEVKSKEGMGVWQLEFVCPDCHKKIHFEKGFKETLISTPDKFWLKVLSEALYHN